MKSSDIYGSGEFLKATKHGRLTLVGEPSNFVGQIARIELGEGFGGDGKQAIIVFTDPNAPKFGLNKTNFNLIADHLRQEDSDHWVGAVVEVGVAPQPKAESKFSPIVTRAYFPQQQFQPQWGQPPALQQPAHQPQFAPPGYQQMPPPQYAPNQFMPPPQQAPPQQFAPPPQQQMFQQPPPQQQAPPQNVTPYGLPVQQPPAPAAPAPGADTSPFGAAAAQQVDDRLAQANADPRKPPDKVVDRNLLIKDLAANGIVVPGPDVARWPRSLLSTVGQALLRIEQSIDVPF